MSLRFAIIGLIMALVTLLSLGIVMLASTSFWAREAGFSYEIVYRQLRWILIGCLGGGVAFKIKHCWLFKFSSIAYVISLVLLTLCYLPGIGIIRNGASRWIHFPIIGQFQPSEMAKLVTVIFLAVYLSKKKANIKNIAQGLLIPIGLILLPVGLIFFEKDMGTASILALIGLILLFVAGVSKRYLGIVFFSGLGGLMILIKLNENRWSRIMAFLDLETHKLDYGLQQWRSLVGLSSGGIYGLGLGNGSSKHGYLPFAHTDFIFAVIGEELGVFFSLLVVFSFCLIVVNSLIITLYVKSYFSKLIGIGMLSLLAVPAIMNVGVVLALLPNTGLPLPFVSYGGTHLVFSLVAVGFLLGLIQDINIKRKKELTKEDSILDRQTSTPTGM